MNARIANEPESLAFRAAPALGAHRPRRQPRRALWFLMGLAAGLALDLAFR